jgi:hypothetical protein
MAKAKATETKHQQTIPAEKLSMGSLKDRVGVKLSDGRTTVFIKKTHNIEQVRAIYEQIINPNYKQKTEVNDGGVGRRMNNTNEIFNREVVATENNEVVE